jgi:signal transduction histidine kinase
MPVPQATSPLAERIHNTVLQMLGSALLKAEMAEQLGRLGRQDEVPAQLLELRASLEQTVAELRREATPGGLKNPGA